MKKFIISFLSLTILLLEPVYSGFYMQHSFNYDSKTESSTTLSSTTMRNIGFLGAQFGSTGNWIIGQSFILWNKSLKNTDMTNTSSLSLLELGPRFQYFFNQGKNIYFSAVYNFYVKGTRKLDGDSEDVSGSSFLVTLGSQMKINKKSYLGFSVNYHSVSLAEKTIGSVQSDITDSHSYIFPTIEYSFRFK